MGLLYPPPLLVPPYLPSINATAGASCNNTCTSEPPVRQRETGEEQARGDRGGWMLREKKRRTWKAGGEGREKTIKMVVGWRDAPCASAGHVSAAWQAERTEGGGRSDCQWPNRSQDASAAVITHRHGDW